MVKHKRHGWLWWYQYEMTAGAYAVRFAVVRLPLWESIKRSLGWAPPENSPTKGTR